MLKFDKIKSLGAFVGILWTVALLMPALCHGDEEPVMMSGQPEISPRTRRLSKEFKEEVQSGRLRKKTNQSLDSIIRLAAYKLKRTGKKDIAEKLIYEWKSQYSLYLERRELGDHKPLSDWLAAQYQIWVFWLGKDICEALRLSDINVINFAIPVVFACIDHVDVDEYRKHFVPLSAVTSYWVTFWTCIGFTWGSGFALCSPISMGVEYIVEKTIAPPLNEPLWKLSCGNTYPYPETAPHE